MATTRTIRVAEVLRQELGHLISRCQELEGYIVTISSVDVTPDLKKAHVYVSLMEESEPAEREVVQILNRQRRDWQATINRRLKLKYTPHLLFSFDDSIQRGDRIMQILTELETASDGEEAGHPQQDGDEPSTKDA